MEFGIVLLQNKSVTHRLRVGDKQREYKFNAKVRSSAMRNRSGQQHVPRQALGGAWIVLGSLAEW